MGPAWPAQVPYHTTVDLFCPEQGVHHTCRTASMGLDGLWVVGSLPLRTNNAVTVSIDDPRRGALQMPCRVTGFTADGIRLDFENPSPASLDRLETIVGPKWNGDDLLEGVLALSNHSDVDDLAGLLHLTTIMEHWRKVMRTTNRARSVNSTPANVPSRA